MWVGVLQYLDGRLTLPPLTVLFILCRVGLCMWGDYVQNCGDVTLVEALF